MCRKKLVKLVDARSRSVEGSGLRNMECQMFVRQCAVSAFQGLVFSLVAHTLK